MTPIELVRIYIESQLYDAHAIDGWLTHNFIDLSHPEPTS